MPGLFAGTGSGLAKSQGSSSDLIIITFRLSRIGGRIQYPGALVEML
jgi:hypothetical protein